MEIRTFGVTDGHFHELLCKDVNEFTLKGFDYERTALVIVEDDKQRPICFIFNFDLADINENNLMRERKDIAFAGSDGNMSWSHHSSYFEAEIFSTRPVHMMNLIEIITEEWKNVHRMYKSMRKYACKYNIKRYTDIHISSF